MPAVGFYIIQRVILYRHRDGGMHRAVPEHDGKRLFLVGRSGSLVFVNLRLGRSARLRR
jgi:hypothetical protein